MKPYCRHFILTYACLATPLLTAQGLAPAFEQTVAHPSVAPRTDGLELIRNGDFKQSAYFWKKTDFYSNYFNGQRLAESTFEIVDESAKIQVKRRGQEHWHAHLLQTGIYLEEGKNYQLSFRAKVEDKDKPEAPISLVASLIKDDTQVKVFYEDGVKVSATDEWQTFTLNFKSPATDDFIRLDLNYGRKLGDSSESERFTISFDDISLRKVGDTSDPRVSPAAVGEHRPVLEYGALEVNDKGQLSSQSLGRPVQLRGVSLHGIQWDRPWYYSNREALIEVKEKWHADIVRVPVYLGQGGYIEDNSLLYSVMQTVDTAISLDMYVIIDWHVHNDAGNPNTYKSQAIAFFDQMAKRYGNRSNVLFEITNEPNGAEWSEIKRYADDVVRIIRGHTNNIIIVGTPVWSQEVQTAAENPILSSNVLYTLHFYAASHPLQNFKSKIEAALAKNVGLFVTEFGTTGFGGDGTPNLNETTQWLDYLDRKGISWIYWTLSAEREESAALKPGTPPVPTEKRGWSDSDLSPSGLFLKTRLTQSGGFDPNKEPVEEGPVKVPGGDLVTEVKIKSDWGNGYCADVIVTNNKESSIFWETKIQIEGQITSAWNAKWSQSGNAVTAKGDGGNIELAAGSSLQWGFCANR